MARCVADRIRGLRASRRWSARRLAEECATSGNASLTRSAIAKIEAGIRKVQEGELEVLAHALGVSTNALTAPEPANPGPVASTRQPDPRRVFISYAHDSDTHVDDVRSLWLVLRQCGIDARLDFPEAERRNSDWPSWAIAEMRGASHVIVVASPTYRNRAEQYAGTHDRTAMPSEAMLLRDEIYRDPTVLGRVIPVVLPGGALSEIPSFLSPQSTNSYTVRQFDLAGTEPLVRSLTGTSLRDPSPALRTEVVIDVATEDGNVRSQVTIAGTRLGETRGRLPDDVARVWQSHDADAVAATARLARVGQALASVLFDSATTRILGDLASGLQPHQVLDVVLVADGDALALPVELLPLRPSDGTSPGPLALRQGVVVRRQPRDVGASLPTSLGAGPLKILAAVAAPEPAASGPTLDVEAEMQAILDCTWDFQGDAGAEVRILEIASLDQIVAAVRDDDFQVLHLAAHGTAEVIELEDEDGHAVPISARDLVDALRDAGGEVPLIVLASCSSGSGGTTGLAAALVRSGAGHIIAMQTTVSDRYATNLARELYRGLGSRRGMTIGAALTRARHDVEVRRRNENDSDTHPEWGVPTLFSAGPDAPLFDASLPPRPLTRRTVIPTGTSVRELSTDRLIGRRAELRTAWSTLRRTAAAVEEHGAISGVVLEGLGGIGKTAVAGRLVTRLKEEGYRYAVHEGRWNPTALFTAIRNAISGDPALAPAVEQLADSGIDDPDKLAVVHSLLAHVRLVIVFDDFEQNLAAGGEAFLDHALEDVITDLCYAARTGSILVTCRYPIPGPDRFLVRVQIPALSAGEVRRLLLRMPALRALPAEEHRILTRTIGGHPRLVEFLDALVRGGWPALHETALKLRALAMQEGVDLARPRAVGDALADTVLLGRADILLDGLRAMLRPAEDNLLRQLSVTRAPLALDDITFALDQDESDNARREQVAADAARLVDLTLLSVRDGEFVMQPWIAEAVSRSIGQDLGEQHERALAARMGRLRSWRGTFADLVEVGRHLAALGRYDDLLAFATEVLDLLGGTLAIAAYLAEVRPLVPKGTREFVLVADMELRALVTAGNMRGARLLAEEILRETTQRVVANPVSTESQHDLSVSHHRLGDLARATGDLAQARSHYDAALMIAERLATADRNNSEWQRDVSVSHHRLGDLFVASGDLTQARTHYEDALNIVEALAGEDPSNVGWLRDLSVSHDRLGDLAVAMGDSTQARLHYDTGLTIRERLAAADPANTGWQRDLSVSHHRLGTVARAVGDLAQARLHYDTGLTIRERLAAADPANTGWQRDLSVSHDQLGELAVAAGDLNEARAHYYAALAIAERLAAGAGPTHAQWQRDLSVSRNRLGGLAAARGDFTEAHAHFDAALAIAERIAAADPTNTEWQRDLSVSRNRLGDLAAARGDFTEAHAHFDAAHAIAERLAVADPTNPQWQRDLAVSHNRLGDVAIASDDRSEARMHYDAALGIAERLAATDPTNPQLQRDLAVSHNRLGDLAQVRGDTAQADVHYKHALAIAERLQAGAAATRSTEMLPVKSHFYDSSFIRENAFELPPPRQDERAGADAGT